MLILTRKDGESILIGDDIEIVMLGNNGRSTRVGIVAPQNITVLRKELRGASDHEDQPHDD